MNRFISFVSTDKKLTVIEYNRIYIVIYNVHTSLSQRNRLGVLEEGILNSIVESRLLCHELFTSDSYRGNVLIYRVGSIINTGVRLCTHTDCLYRLDGRLDNGKTFKSLDRLNRLNICENFKRRLNRIYKHSVRSIPLKVIQLIVYFCGLISLFITTLFYVIIGSEINIHTSRNQSKEACAEAEEKIKHRICQKRCAIFRCGRSFSPHTLLCPRFRGKQINVCRLCICRNRNDENQRKHNEQRQY